MHPRNPTEFFQENRVYFRVGVDRAEDLKVIELFKQFSYRGAN